METEKTTIIKGYKIFISRNDYDDVLIDYINKFEEPAGGLFE